MLLARLRPWPDAAPLAQSAASLAEMPDVAPLPLGLLIEAPPAPAPAVATNAATIQVAPAAPPPDEGAAAVPGPGPVAEPAAPAAEALPPEPGRDPEPVLPAPGPEAPRVAAPETSPGPETFDFPFDALAALLARLEGLAAGIAGVQQSLDALPPPPAGSDVVLPVLAEFSPLG